MIRIEKEIARRQRLLLAYHTYTLGLKTEHRQMDHPLNLFFLVLTLGPDTEAEWLHVYLPYSWFGSVHWSTIRQIWQWICLSQGLLWKHLKINRDVVKRRTFISGFFIPFIMSFGQRIPHQWQRNRTDHFHWWPNDGEFFPSAFIKRLRKRLCDL